mmetsp:Transcript_6620/g.27018  ORF Transcript_6620/g.27018 Transcript_6620/m.27018 type:complete len:106 (-) Transcript_6620:811-1128(-)
MPRVTSPAVPVGVSASDPIELRTEPIDTRPGRNEAGDTAFAISAGASVNSMAADPVDCALGGASGDGPADGAHGLGDGPSASEGAGEAEVASAGVGIGEGSVVAV